MVAVKIKQESFSVNSFHLKDNSFLVFFECVCNYFLKIFFILKYIKIIFFLFFISVHQNNMKI
jgi:hypothetical protein